MKQFYNVFSDEKVSPLVTQLTWSHCLILLPIKDINKIYYYVLQVKERNLSKRQLEQLVRNNEYERLPEETVSKLINKDKLEIKDRMPNPILITNKNNVEVIGENALHKLILEDISSFMK